MIKKIFRDRIDTSHTYVHSSKTDITKTFEKVRAQLKAEAERDARVVRPIRKAAAK